MFSPLRRLAGSPALRSLCRRPPAAGRAAPLSSDASSMSDEYGAMTSDGSTYAHPVPFVLENGSVLERAELRYRTYSDTVLNARRDNVLVVCHALTGNASLDLWWGGLLGPGKAFDTSKYVVVCANILGSCYGSTNPASVDPSTGAAYGADFPDVSVADTVRLQLALLRDLGIGSVAAVVGGSFGGMQAVEFAAQAGRSVDGAAPFVRSALPIACGARHTAWQIAISECQRQAIYADPRWRGGRYTAGEEPRDGLAVARQFGMVSYRTPRGYDDKFGRQLQTPESPPYGAASTFAVKNYLEYQGQKFLDRFDPLTYVRLTEQMDSHDVGRHRGGIDAALATIAVPCRVVGIDSDVLYPLHEQEELAGGIPDADLVVVRSDAGHDGFLLEQEQVGAAVQGFLDGLEPAP